ncbi:MAG: sigma 54-interacting transcriptional regulator [Nitrospira sp.]|nr:sigma 54-interacting transcriptional regulator [Nitrospira sp.]
MDSKPMPDHVRALSILGIFAMRASAEFDRLRYEQALRKSDLMLRKIDEGTAAVTGSAFFPSLVKSLAEALQTRYAFVSKFVEGTRTRVRTLAFWKGDGFLDSFEYDLPHTPCERVLSGEVCLFPEKVQDLFPDHREDLAKLGVESYLAIPVFDRSGTVMGHLAVMDTKPMRDDPRVLSVFKIFKIGRFEVADKGTIFLDEIGELPLDLQSKLLRVLQEGEFERVGGTQTFKVNVRVIAATNRNLDQLSKSGQYRPDLYYRLNVFPVHLPPLREREGDIPLLAQYFVQKCSANLGKKITRIPERMLGALQRYQWPGNIRELEHVIERAVILSEGPQLEPIEWLTPTSGKPSGSEQVLTLEEMERQHIVDVLEQTNWRVSGEKGAAKILGLNATTLEARMKKLGIERQKREV